jgi:hypothetical protein
MPVALFLAYLMELIALWLQALLGVHWMPLLNVMEVGKASAEISSTITIITSLQRPCRL